MSKTGFVIGLLIGATIGSAASFVYCRERFQKQREKDLAEYKARHKSVIKDENDIRDAEKNDKEPINDVPKSANDAFLKYGGSKNLDEVDADSKFKNPPVIIPSSEMGENPTYPVIDLMYFSDGVLTSMEGDELDIDDLIGSDNVDHIGEEVDDRLYIRNDRLRTYYEVESQKTTFYDEDDGGDDD